jgi:hypothetical protein
MARVRLRDTETRPSRLPEVCIVCGEPSAKFSKKVFSWYPWWAALPLFLLILPGAVTMMIFTKRRTVHVPYCSAHRRYFQTRGFLTWLPLIVFIILVPFAVLLPPFLLDPKIADDEAPIMWIVLGVCLLTAILTVVILLNTGVRATEITDDSIALTGVDEEFANGLRDLREERRRSRRDEDDEDDDDRPRRRRRDDDDDDYDERPRRRSADYEDDDYDERPRRRRRDDDEEDDRPRRRRSEDDDDLPRRSRRDDDDAADRQLRRRDSHDDEPPPRRQRDDED